jgi:energy-coupling factor transporter transmembrane protein EcfT
MESRGFRIYPDRTSYCKLSMSKMDYATIIAASAAVFLIISYNFNIIG